MMLFYFNWLAGLVRIYIIILLLSIPYFKYNIILINKYHIYYLQYKIMVVENIFKILIKII